MKEVDMTTAISWFGELAGADRLQSLVRKAGVPVGLRPLVDAARAHLGHGSDVDGHPAHR